MRRIKLAWSAPDVLALAALGFLTLAVPASAAPQRSQSGGRATSSHPASGGGGSSRPAPSSGGGGGNGGGSNSGSQPSSAPRAVPRNADGTTTGTTSTSPRPTSNHAPTSGAAVGRATQPIPGSGGGAVVIPNGYYGGFYPWGWAGLGFGGFYGGYYGYYDPWVDAGGSGGYYGQPYTTSGGYDDGLMRLKVKPRDGVVYVDGFFAGRVDDYDGVFQRLHIEPGPHHIEITADGYEPLELDVQIQRGRTITYSGDLKKVQ